MTKNIKKSELTLYEVPNGDVLDNINILVSEN